MVRGNVRERTITLEYKERLKSEANPILYFTQAPTRIIFVSMSPSYFRVAIDSLMSRLGFQIEKTWVKSLGTESCPPTWDTRHKNTLLLLDFKEENAQAFVVFRNRFDCERLSSILRVFRGRLCIEVAIAANLHSIDDLLVSIVRTSGAKSRVPLELLQGAINVRVLSGMEGHGEIREVEIIFDPDGDLRSPTRNAF